jgi:hypothetical protein
MRMRVENSTRPNFVTVTGYPRQPVMVIDPAIESDYGTGSYGITQCLPLSCRVGSGIIGGRGGVPAFGGAAEQPGSLIIGETREDGVVGVIQRSEPGPQVLDRQV